LKEVEEKTPQISSSLVECAKELSLQRHEATGKLTASVLNELAELSMKDAVFEVLYHPPAGKGIVSIDSKPYYRYGADSIEFAFSANSGISASALSTVASGGEMSRISLALKLALSEVSQPATMIFDEIDSGIGGETANKLADSLKRASGSKQVIVITHLARIAAKADNHLSVEKRQTEGIPETDVTSLETVKSRENEIARLLGGGKAALEHAKAMLKTGGE